MKKIVIGAIANVDAGKTTLSESLLFRNKVLRKKGRVDHKDAYLDFNNVEKEKGITIFNKEARFSYKDKEYIYIDTPGHNDLSFERDRSLKIIDYAILLISAIDDFNIAKPIYENLKQNKIKTFIFLNKIDIAHETSEILMNKLKDTISRNIVTIYELEELVKEQLIIDVQESLKKHEIIPIILGSALKDINIDLLLDTLDTYTVTNEASNILNAYIYKYDEKGYAHLKILSGTLLNKTSFDSNNKINEMYSINGNNYSLIQEANQNDVVAISGLKYKIGTYLPSLVNDEDIDILNNRMIISSLNAYTLFNKIKSLNNLMPELNIKLDNDIVTININSSLKQEIIIKIIKDKFNLEVTIDDISIIKEEIVELEPLEPETDNSPYVYKREEISDEELKRVFNNTYKPKTRIVSKKKEEIKQEQIINYKDIIYLIDGYNLLHTLKEYKEEDFSLLRDKIIDMVCDFAGYINGQCVLVFDAYKTEEKQSRIIKHDNITIVYTKNKQTADEYIENKSKELNKDYKVIVVTSDYLEQIRVFANGASRMSSREFIERYDNFSQDKKIEHKPNRPLESLRQLLEDDDC